jgi:hypothetical protein
MSTSHLSLEQAMEVYHHCRSAIEVSLVTTKQRQRRSGQLTWMSIVDVHRKLRRQSRATNSQ